MNRGLRRRPDGAGRSPTGGRNLPISQPFRLDRESAPSSADDLVNFCPNVTVTDIDVVDDKIGILATGETLTGVDILSLTATQFLTEETTNTVTVTFDQDGIQCTDCDSETITVGIPPDPSTVCSTRASALLLRYTGMDILGATVEIEPDKSPLVTYVGVDLIEGVTVLSDPGELGFSVNAKPDEIELGAKTRIRINGVVEELHTSCSTPLVSGEPAPLNNPKGDPSALWFVESFEQKP